MSKAASIALLWIATISVLAILFFAFVQPYAQVSDPGFVIWSLGKPLAFIVVLVAIGMTKRIYSKKQPR